MPSNKQNSSQPKRRRKLVIISSIMALPLVLIFGAYLYHQHALAADKARFTQAEQDIAKLSSEITATAGTPLKVDNQKFCSRPHLKYEEGVLTCHVSSDLFYGVNNEKEATEIFTTASSTIQNKWERRTISSSNNLNKNSFNEIISAGYMPTRDRQQIVEEYNSSLSKETKCWASYNFYLASQPPFTEYLATDKNHFILAVGLSCSIPAMREYYPMNN